MIVGRVFSYKGCIVQLIYILKTFSWKDAVDILILSVVAYYLILGLKKPKARKAAFIMIVLAAVYLASLVVGLNMITSVFNELWPIILILLIVAFQPEIRQFFEKGGFFKLKGAKPGASEPEIMSELSETVFDLAETRTGALIILVRKDDPDDFIHGGQAVLAQPKPNLLKSIFNPHSPSHDGAVIMIDGKIEAMGCVLPLTQREDIPEEYGTRHRAALGISEHTDSVSIVVSEERGRVSTVVNGSIEEYDSPDALYAGLSEHMDAGRSFAPGFNGLNFMIKDLPAKLAALAIVLGFWFIMAGQQVITVDIQASVGYVNIPVDVVMGKKTKNYMQLKVSGTRSLVGRLDPGQVTVDVNLSGLTPGNYEFNLDRADVELPEGLTIDPTGSNNINVELMKRP